MAKNRFLRTFGSLKLAVFSILLLATVLATATAVESMFGMRAAHVLVYGRVWFGAVLFLLGLNVLCAALVRYPWKKRQTGFVVTHAGILILLAGSAVTQKYGVDGSLPVVEGSDGREVLLPETVLRFSETGSGKIVEIGVPETATKATGDLLRFKFEDGDEGVISEYYPRARVSRRYVASPLPGVGQPALSISLHNSRFDVREWLALEANGRAERTVGPARLTLRRVSSKAEEKKFLEGSDRRFDKSGAGTLVLQYGRREFRFPVDAGRAGAAPVEGTGLTIQVLRYLPYAVVEGANLVTRSQEPTNPAVELLLRDKQGREEKHTLFALFPDFSTLHKSHRKAGQDPIGVTFRYEHPKAQRQAPSVRGELDLAVTDDGRVLYRVAATARPAQLTSGVAEIGKGTPTGWMDLEFAIEDRIDDAVVQEAPSYAHYIQQGDGNLPSALKLRIEPGPETRSVASAKPYEVWFTEGDVRQVPIGGRTVLAQFSKRRIQLPFSIQLDRFHIATDPGTEKAASYESTVTVREEKGNGPSALIQMNEPLHHGGYAFYQASYSFEEGRPPVSVFSVNWDPGRWIKYLGSLLIVLGASLMFYMNPQYWDKMFGALFRRRPPQEKR